MGGSDQHGCGRRQTGVGKWPKGGRDEAAVPKGKDSCHEDRGTGTSLVVRWLRLRASTAGGAGSIPGQGTKIPHASRPMQQGETGTQAKPRAGDGHCWVLGESEEWAPKDRAQSGSSSGKLRGRKVRLGRD